MQRRALVAFGLTGPAVLQASLRDWRMHEWCRFGTQNGQVIAVMVRGDLTKLTNPERDFLDHIAEMMTELQQPLPAAEPAKK